MILAALGISVSPGKTGHCLVEQLLRKGHEVRGYGGAPWGRAVGVVRPSEVLCRGGYNPLSVPPCARRSRDDFPRLRAPPFPASVRESPVPWGLVEVRRGPEGAGPGEPRRSLRWPGGEPYIQVSSTRRDHPMHSNRTIKSLLILPLALALVLLGRPGPASAGEEQILKGDAVARAGFVPASFGPNRLLYAFTRTSKLGIRRATATYGPSKRKATVDLEVQWGERGSAAVTPTDYRRPTPGDVRQGTWWSETHQIKARVTDRNTRDRVGLEALTQLARNAVAGLRSRAQPLPGALGRIRLPRSIKDYRLSRSQVLPVWEGHGRDGHEKMEVDYGRRAYGEMDQRRLLTHRRDITIELEWIPVGIPPGNTIQFAAPRKPRITTPGDGAFQMRSRTHYIYASVSGIYHDKELKSRSGFRDETHIASARTHVHRLFKLIERDLAQRRGAALPNPNGSRHVSDRPAASGTPGASAKETGTVSADSTGFVVFRGQGRANVRPGGRVQVGDRIMTRPSGRVTVRFDNERGGPGQMGTLTVSLGSSVTIRTAPLKRGAAKTTLRIGLEKGSLRFERPHDRRNPRVELLLEGNGGIFGLDGTNVAVALRDNRYYIVVRDGRVTHQRKGKVVSTLTAGTLLLLDARGVTLAQQPVSDAQLQDWNKRLGLPPSLAEAKGTSTGPWRFVPKAGDTFRSSYEKARVEKSVADWREALQRAEQAYASFKRRLPTLSPADAEEANAEAQGLIQDAYDAYDVVMDGFPDVVGEPWGATLDKYLPGFRAAGARLGPTHAALWALRADEPRTAKPPKKQPLRGALVGRYKSTRWGGVRITSAPPGGRLNGTWGNGNPTRMFRGDVSPDGRTVTNVEYSDGGWLKNWRYAFKLSDDGTHITVYETRAAGVDRASLVKNDKFVRR